jgi:hypothetical protein
MILRVVPSLHDEESLPLLVEEPLADEEVEEGDFGRLGSGIR